MSVIKTFSVPVQPHPSTTERADPFDKLSNTTAPLTLARTTVPRRGLSEADFQKAAKALKLKSVASIKAVAQVESMQQGFDSRGNVPVLFERHVFHQCSGGKHQARAPQLSQRQPGGYGRAADQHKRLNAAAKLDERCALMSASWGRFQILGINHKRADYATIHGFVAAMRANEANHLKAFVNFIKSDPALHKALQAENWTAFARAYNGPAYKKNQYDLKLRKAYASFVNPPLQAKVRT